MMESSDDDDEMAHRNKRRRDRNPDVDDLMRFARDIWRRDDRYNEKERSLKMEERNFREWFGCRQLVALAVWSMLVKTDLLPAGGELHHLLWTLAFLKVYAREHVMAVSFASDRQTVGKWVWLFLDAIASLEPYIVSAAFVSIVTVTSNHSP